MTQKIAALIRTGFVEKKEDYSFDSQRVFDIELFRAAYDCLTYYIILLDLEDLFKCPHF